ncbi:MAG: bifunctional ornithine acetyltransferase/N-acetylglutamate synthase [Alteromonadaceae bacterium]|nr:bifunctional ornithine acetyltransferase/N-acetylglutamate synthase [Alteromonadaceae bacterium]
MAVGLGPLPKFHSIDGVRIGVASAGIKKPGRKDVVVFEIARGSAVAALFTRNQFRAAPVRVASEHLAAEATRYLLINTGNANAGTGERGMTDARACCAALAAKCDVPVESILPFSTGVIGEPLPVSKLTAALPEALADLKADGWAAAASGIMTTDTLPKGATRQVAVGEEVIHLSGISKGAGMIRPDMATMLGFIATDARIDSALWQRLLAGAIERSFNRVTVDGDTSTNDACVAVATGCSAVPEIAEGGAGFIAFRDALNSLCLELAQALVRDGEGATKFITIAVEQARDRKEALDVAFTIAHSPLVKTALFASDPNWGRILAAVGRAGVENLDLDAVRIHLGDVCIVHNGARAEDYTEARGQAVMNESEISITVNLGRGAVKETVWTCDFSHDYVTINAEYRT